MLFEDDFSSGLFVSFPQGMREIGFGGREIKRDDTRDPEIYLDIAP